MALDQPSVLPKGVPLSMMKRLSPAVFIHEPSSEAQTSAARIEGPRFILMFAWYSSQDAHDAKYINQHITLSPTARILLVKCPFKHMFPFTSHELQPAVDALGAFVDTLSSSDEHQGSQLLIHSFSNGGGYNFARFARLWEKKTGGALPPHVTVLDSAPDRFTWSGALSTATAPTPWYLRPVAMAVLIVMVLVVNEGFRVRKVSDVAFYDLLDMAILAKEERRAYIYSKEDPMVGYKDVELHAQEVEQKSAKLRLEGRSLVVRKELFVGSGHVSHARLDSERYWRIVRETCEGEPGAG